MTEHSFSISGSAYKPKDKAISADTLAAMGFRSEDGANFKRGNFEYEFQSGDIYYNGKLIVSCCRMSASLAAFIRSIDGETVQW